MPFPPFQVCLSQFVRAFCLFKFIRPRLAGPKAIFKEILAFKRLFLLLMPREEKNMFLQIA